MRVRALAAAALFAVIATAGPGAAQSEPWQERERVRQQQEALGADLDVLHAQDAELAAALQELEAQVGEAQGRLAEAQAAVAAAEARVAEAEAAVAGTQRSIDAQVARLQRLAVEAYMGHGKRSPAGTVLAADDMAEATERLAVVDVVATDIDAVVDELERSRARLDRQRRVADEAADAAAELRADAEAQLAAVSDARDVQAAFAAEVEARIEARLAEAAALEALDAQLSADLRAQQAALAEFLARAGGGASRSGAVPLVGPDDLRVVRGITVHHSIAEQLEALLAAAEADGIVLGGGGHRSSEAQIRLREAHCPDVWESPPSACTPPTARPGSSLHERGLAIDFTYNGDGISTQDNPAFVWLAANAERFGFYNLPSEPWHWSTTGQ